MGSSPSSSTAVLVGPVVVAGWSTSPEAPSLSPGARSLPRAEWREARPVARGALGGEALLEGSESRVTAQTTIPATAAATTAATSATHDGRRRAGFGAAGGGAGGPVGGPATGTPGSDQASDCGGMASARAVGGAAAAAARPAASDTCAVGPVGRWSAAARARRSVRRSSESARRGSWPSRARPPSSAPWGDRSEPPSPAAVPR